MKKDPLKNVNNFIVPPNIDDSIKKYPKEFFSVNRQISLKEGTLGYILEGAVRCQLTLGSGEKRTISLKGPGYWMGVESFVCSVQVTYTTLIETRYAVVEINDFKSKLPRAVLYQFSHCLALDWDMNIGHFLTQKSGIKRILSRLIDMRFQIPYPEVAITHHDIADLAGLERSYTTRILRKIEQMGHIKCAYGSILFLSDVNELHQMLKQVPDFDEA